MVPAFLQAIREAAGRWPASWRLLWADRGAMALLGIASALVTSAAIAPLAAWLVDRFIASTGRAELSDLELVGFLLTPVGLAGAALVAGTLVLARDLAEALVHRRLEHPGVPPMRLALDLVPRVPALLITGIGLVAALGAVAAPFVLAGWSIARSILVQDIHYYLDARPAEWWLALGLAGAVGAAGLAALVLTLAAFLRVTPLVAVDGLGPWAAVRESVAAFRRRPLETIATVVVYESVTLTQGVILAVASARLGATVIDAMPDRPGPLAVAVTLAFAVNSLVAAAANFLAIALMAAMIRRLDGREPAGGEAPRGVGPAASAAAWTVAISIAAVGAVLAVDRIADRARRLAPPEIIAHRGGTPEAPENTLEAFRTAISRGADWIELDVQRDADGTVVVLHDRDFRRVAGDPRRLEDLPGSEWRNFGIQAWKPRPFGTERAPTLAETLALDWGTTGLLVELKTYRPDPGLVPEVVRVLAGGPGPSRLRLMSFDERAVAEFRRLRPDVPTGLLVKTVAGDVFRAEADFLAVSAEVATTRFLDRAELAGREILTWTVNTEADMLRLMALGVRGIITDDVELARRARARFAAMSPSEFAALVVRTRFRE